MSRKLWVFAALALCLAALLGFALAEDEDVTSAPVDLVPGEEETLLPGGDAVSEGYADFVGEVSAAEGIALTSANFPDASFLNYLAEEWDEDGDGVLSAEETEYLTYISVYDTPVASVKGIELFPQLVNLDCAETLVSSLDLSGNPNLEVLSCYNTQLTTLDLSRTPRLQQLACGGNRLTGLDLSGNPELVYIDCGRNALLTKLDVSGNTKLESLRCYDCGLTALDISGMTMTYLDCSGNELTSLNVRGCPRLAELHCSENRLTGLDLTGITTLANLECNGNQMDRVDLSAFLPAVKSLFTAENTRFSYNDTMVIGNDNYSATCDNYVELVLDGKVLRPMNVKRISLGDEEGIKLLIGRTYQLKPVYEPADVNPVLTYSISEYSEQYVSVSDTGLVTALKPGFGAVRVTADNGVYAMLQIEVTVSEISLGGGYVELAPGDVFQLTPEFIPADASARVTYSIPDDACVTVSDTGLVTAVKPGACFVEAVTEHDQSDSKLVSVITPEIKLKADIATLKRGETLQLKPKVDPKRVKLNLKYKSSDKKVATVDKNGLVTAVGQGSCTITVSAKDYDVIEDYLSLAVTDPDPAKVTLNKSKATLGVKQTLTLKATVAPEDAGDKTVTWKSSKKAVATVSASGKVTAKATGSTTITATTANGKKAKCVITVKPAPKKVTLYKGKTKLKSGKKLTLKKGKSLTLTAKPTSGSATKLTWTSTAPKVAKVDKNGKVTALKKGSATITVMTHNKKKATVKITVK